MLRVAVSPNSILPGNEVVLEGVLQSQFVLGNAQSHRRDPTPTVFAVELMTRKAEGEKKKENKSLQQPATTPTVEPDPKHATNGANTSAKFNAGMLDESLTSTTSLPDADNIIQPIKNQVTLRKIYIVFVVLVLLRTFNLSYLPAGAFHPSFPYLPLHYAAPEPPTAGTHLGDAFEHYTQLKANTYLANDSPSFLQSMFIMLTRSIALLMLDVVRLHMLILTNPMTILVFILGLALHPLFGWLDHRVQHFFYDRPTHTNIHQLPDSIMSAGKKGFKYFKFFLFGLAAWPLMDPMSREAHFVLVLCTVWMSVVKRVLKNLANMLRMSVALRPPNEAFPRGLYFGGFPSGHVSQTFMTVVAIYYVWGAHNVLIYALLIQTLMTAAWVLSCNRHFVSQIVAGLALGVIYGLAVVSWLHSMFGPVLYHPSVPTSWGLL